MSIFNKDPENSDTERSNVIPIRDRRRKSRAEVRQEMNQKRVALSASLLSVAFAIGLLNQQLLKVHNSRSIASEGPTDNQWQYDIASQVSKDARRDIASLGRKPNEIDQLKYEYLEGKYGLRFDNGSLFEITFDEKSTGDRPKYIQDKESFLMTYKKLFNIDFDKATKIKSVTSPEGNVQEEFFDLVDRNSKTKAQAHFKSDSAGRVLLVRLNRVDG